MKKIIFLFSFLFISNYSFAQQEPSSCVDTTELMQTFTCVALSNPLNLPALTDICNSHGGELVEGEQCWESNIRTLRCFKTISNCSSSLSSASSSSSSGDTSSSASASSLPYCSEVEAPAMCLPDPASSSPSNNSSSPPVSSSPPISSASGSTGSNTSSDGDNRDVNPSPTSSTELCELNFGVGNCAPVPLATPCPNSYTVNGQKFCVTNSASNSSSGSSSDSSSGSGVGTSAPTNSATANNCSTQPTCSGDDAIQCAILRQSWLNFCDGAENKTDINAESDNENIEDAVQRIFRENAAVLNSDGTVKGTGGEVKLGDNAGLIDQLNSYASGASSGSCPASRQIRLSTGSYELSYQPFCDLASSISYLVLLSFTIFGSLIIYKTLERA